VQADRAIANLDPPSTLASGRKAKVGNILAPPIAAFNVIAGGLSCRSPLTVMHFLQRAYLGPTTRRLLGPFLFEPV
jgi:hypothetical protein